MNIIGRVEQVFHTLLSTYSRPIHGKRRARTQNRSNGNKTDRRINFNTRTAHELEITVCRAFDLANSGQHTTCTFDRNAQQPEVNVLWLRFCIGAPAFLWCGANVSHIFEISAYLSPSLPPHAPSRNPFRMNLCEFKIFACNLPYSIDEKIILSHLICNSGEILRTETSRRNSLQIRVRLFGHKRNRFNLVHILIRSF